MIFPVCSFLNGEFFLVKLFVNIIKFVKNSYICKHLSDKYKNAYIIINIFHILTQMYKDTYKANKTVSEHTDHLKLF